MTNQPPQQPITPAEAATLDPKLAPPLPRFQRAPIPSAEATSAPPLPRQTMRPPSPGYASRPQQNLPQPQRPYQSPQAGKGFSGRLPLPNPLKAAGQSGVTPPGLYRGPSVLCAVININKPSGCTSHDVVDRLRRVFKTKKVGHMGTLDPLATGVLPLAIGHATRLLEYYPTQKGYRVSVTFGKTTTTWDSEGDITKDAPLTAPLDEAQLTAALNALSGTYEQRIPLYSAKKVGGKKLYELARSGVEMADAELPTKTVTIDPITLVSVDNTVPYPTAILDVTCTGGTYMRTLAYDLGERLGCGAYMSQLVRTQAGLFTLDKAIDLDALEAMENPSSVLESPIPTLGMPAWSLPLPGQILALQNGNPVSLPELPPALAGLKDGDLCVLTKGEQLIAVASWMHRKLRPIKIFK